MSSVTPDCASRLVANCSHSEAYVSSTPTETMLCAVAAIPNPTMIATMKIAFRMMPSAWKLKMMEPERLADTACGRM